MTSPEIATTYYQRKIYSCRDAIGAVIEDMGLSVGKVEGKSNSIYYPYVPDHSTLASRSHDNLLHRKYFAANNVRIGSSVD
ncbi:hypothetical protein Bca4012_056492 [Brassica carinata]|uniref:Uncharacterized protein n=1 Tax=Brassica carinata TaxID=52824 RepID=A0A8X7QP83_BRACI|nr:hypothetical protein Bca52824_065803 [Brassica carinata]